MIPATSSWWYPCNRLQLYVVPRAVCLLAGVALLLLLADLVPLEPPLGQLPPLGALLHVSLLVSSLFIFLFFITVMITSVSKLLVFSNRLHKMSVSILFCRTNKVIEMIVTI